MPTATEVITSAWTPPPQVEGFSITAGEFDSFITLNWTASTLAAEEFSVYRIYRRPTGDALWGILIDLDNQAIEEYTDVTAAQATEYEYMITQFKQVVGDVPLESDPSEIATIILETDAWFVVMSNAGNWQSMELNVVDENHQAVIQQEVFEPLATTRKRIVRGNVMGEEGQLTASVDTAEVRVYKQNFYTLSHSRGPHILKSPFGDVWYVEFDSPAYKYRTGGHLEITIGWVEI